MSAVGIGTKLRQARISQGLALEDIARATRIQQRYLDAIEAEDLDSLPGLVFTRNFVRQYAIALKLDPEPLLASLPKLDESRVQLPVAPKVARSRRWDSRSKSLLTTAAWLAGIAGAVTGAVRYVDFRYLDYHIHRPPVIPSRADPPRIVEEKPVAPVPAAQASQAAIRGIAAPTSPVQVVVTARETTWVSLAADGKSSFAGTLRPNETRQVSAIEQVKLIAGNAGGVTVSLNGKTLDPIGPQGQVRVVKLTAEGPEFLAKVPPTAPDPL
ncbi:MAG TPA: RodZ domain-containing protein [Bryobacteraceae bacterium]|nr:RodZ domain-containing protein [Bryobacteraceae bacterium]